MLLELPGRPKIFDVNSTDLRCSMPSHATPCGCCTFDDKCCFTRAIARVKYIYDSSCPRKHTALMENAIAGCAKAVADSRCFEQAACS